MSAPLDVLAADKSNLTEMAVFFPEAKRAPRYSVTQMSERCWAFSGPGFFGTRPTQDKAEAAALAKFGGAA